MLSFNDPRSQLFFEFVRLVRECNPKYFLLENVVMRKQDQAVITTLLGVSPIKINSSLVSAQNRPRLYWTNIPIHSLPNDKGITFGSVMENNPSPKYNLSQSAIDRVMNALRGRKKFYGAHSPKVGAMLAQYAKNPTDGCYVDDGVSKRKITPLEAERLQTIPDGYTASIADTHRYHAIGNGWTVDVIAHIFSGLNQPVATP
jgi:site-specific DNA-cytosine methylase